MSGKVRDKKENCFLIFAPKNDHYKQMLTNISRPTLLVNENQCRSNIQSMLTKATTNGAVFRPHFKTHQSGLIGKWFADAGIKAITVSSVKMATYFATHGWKDITIAFPVNLRELDAIDQLACRVRLQLVVDDEQVFEQIGQQVKNACEFMIKIDVGYQRAGIPMENAEAIASLAARIQNSKQHKLRGLLTHAGQNYRAGGGISQVEATTRIAGEKMQALRHVIGRSDLVLSWGDTPSCSMLNHIPYFDEWRPGNFVFYDVMQYHIGSCQFSDIAVAMACPVVSVYPERGELLMYGGSVHFSGDYIAGDNNFRLYGYVVPLTENGWGQPLPSAYVASLSQEHGIVRMSQAQLKFYKPGDLIGILPIHSCLTADAVEKMQSTTGFLIPKM